jgi:hypothetical protein
MPCILIHQVYNNTATGGYALYSNIAGANNTAYGYSALYNNTADNNTAIGTKRSICKQNRK